jgi:hypothetical protein
MADKLPPIPIDDAALDSIEHALAAVYTVDDEGEHHIHGAEYNLPQLLDFWSGFNHDAGVLTGYAGDVPIYTFDQATYTERDLIRALVTEVRHLRGAE